METRQKRGDGLREGAEGRNGAGGGSGVRGRRRGLLDMRSVHQPRGFKYEARKGTKEETTPSLYPTSDGLIKNLRGENNIGRLRCSLRPADDDDDDEDDSLSRSFVCSFVRRDDFSDVRTSAPS